MENCKNCQYVKENGCFEYASYTCAITDNHIAFPIRTGGSKKCVCYKRAEKKKAKFVYPTSTDLEDYEIKCAEETNKWKITLYKGDE